MLASLAHLRATRLAQLPLQSIRTMTSKSSVVKAKDTATGVKTASSTFVAKATYAGRASVASKAAAAPRQYNKSDFSTTGSTAASTYSSPSSYTSKTYSSPSAAAATSPSASSDSSYPEYSDDSLPSAKIGGDASQAVSEAFANNNTTMKDATIGENGIEDGQDWTRSFSGMAVEPFEREVADILMSPLDPDDIEIKPDGLLYLPEIKYRRILNKAFGPGGWGLAPRSEHSVSPKTISREYALICRGRFVSSARGEQDYFDPSNLATASEGCKSNALMRCCKDLGVASELWDPSFIRKFKKQYCEEHFAEHVVTKRKKRLWKRKDNEFEYPYAKSK
ncbi:hypothetical protein EMPS_01686 [Entomortierella parvispora]|uniref:Mitochondrial genome maintenance protein MGM101 n=1 Tax=Entomortierella parvispora TaxID=205924 RepID=A0A9P3LT70_9FUNG|nr:hypothetical protein EMPS_01686 [Entomortierella parvispora]